ncbi:nitroreductase family protein [Pseudooceanicola batsensis HTCC2597]|uniref:Nitroreductase family protein n=1 Tax=Pseudooceanicola batsensis (strain ATCC BAA-863 / DSM 15984 / KCTC 12145 / HTCC2597) TaxID=252305 RepID=A3TYP7_PSEBH|nr:nitroreductase [Pseudooceanicola batsensis]EAQ02715.1 nitroreductase family protein [Pseudooceanicola batsensis HTCC2597]
MSDYDILTDLLSARFSCRGFRPDPIPEDLIRQIVTAAGRAPSWCNAQPWHVIVTRGDETEAFRQALMQAARDETPQPDVPGPEGYTGLHRERRRTCGWQLYDAVGVTRDDREGSARQAFENFRLFGAPHVAILTSGRELGTYGALDCGGFVMAFCLAAQALGIATVPQAAIAFQSQAVRRHFVIPDDRLILCGISFGLAEENHPANAFRTGRAPLSEIMELRGRDDDPRGPTPAESET